MENRDIPYFLHEADMARMERSHKKLIITLIIAIALVFISNMAWLYFWMQYDYSAEDYTVEMDSGNGVANYIGERGIINGTY